MDEILTLEEVINLVNNTSLTDNQIDNMYTIMNLGEITYNSINNEKWKVCGDLYESMIEELDKNIPDFNYPKIGLNIYIDNCRKENVCIYGINKDILTYLRMFDTEFRDSLNNSIDTVYNKYTLEWDKIGEKYEDIHKLVQNRFGHLEENEDFAELTRYIFRLMDEVNKEVQVFYRYNIDYIENGRLKNDYTMCFNIVMAKHNVEHNVEELLKASLYKNNLEIHKLYLKTLI